MGKDRVLRRIIENDEPRSMILWGPPGTGKTSLGMIVARETRAAFFAVSAVTAGLADIRKIIEQAKINRRNLKRRTILFIDEIHRFNKAQQDALLHSVEDGTVILIGATTENPSFEVIGPLLSRCRVYRLNPLEERHIKSLLERALASGEVPKVKVPDEVLVALAGLAGGDGRAALNGLELCVRLLPKNTDPKVLNLGMEAAQQHRLRRAAKHTADCPSILLQCCALKTMDPSQATGILLVRPFLLESPQAVTISSAGIPLLQALVQFESPTRFTEEIGRRIQSLPVDKPGDIGIRLPYMYSAESKGDTLMILRGPEILILPRAMLLHPLVQQAKLLPGDLLATFPGRDTGGNEKQDLLYQFLMKPEEYVEGDPEMLFTEGSSEVAAAKLKKLAAAKELTFVESLYEGQDSIDKILGLEGGNLGLSQQVFVVVRRRGVFSVSYLIPFSSSGPLGKHGTLFESLFEDSQEVGFDRTKRWADVFSGLLQLEFEGDEVIAATRMERLPIFQSGLK